MAIKHRRSQTISNKQRIQSILLSTTLLLLTAICRELLILSLSPTYGASNVGGVRLRANIVEAVIAACFTTYHVRIASNFIGRNIVFFISLLGSSVPAISAFFGARSELFGPVWGPLLAISLSQSLLTAAACHHAVRTAELLGMHGADTIGRASRSGLMQASFDFAFFVVLRVTLGWAFNAIFPLALVAYVGRNSALAALSCFFALLSWSKLSLFTLPFLFLAILSPHVPMQWNIARLNIKLESEGYAIIARQESITGYLSVLDNLKDGFRVLRCDHSLLGGEWTRYPPGVVPKLKEPVYAIFVMLEAVRLVEPAAPKYPGSDQEAALFIGLGIGTSPAAFINHGIATVIVEIDPVVHQFALDYFDLPRNHTALLGDAMGVIRQINSMKVTPHYDYIVHDVFTGGVEPLELFTVEFLQDLKTLLRSDGTIAINYAGDLNQASAIRVIKTVLTVFPTCRIFRESAASSESLAEDLTNLVMFCRKNKGPFSFREPFEVDFLESRARRDHLFPRHEVSVSDFQDVPGDLVKRNNLGSLSQSQKDSALSHWHVMRTVIPAKVWQNW